MGHFWVTTLVPWALPYHSNITCWYPQYTFLSQHKNVFVAGQSKNNNYQKHCTLVQLPLQCNFLLHSQKLIIQISVWEILKDNTIFWKPIIIYETGGTLDPLLCNAHRYCYTFVGVSCHTCVRIQATTHLLRRDVEETEPRETTQQTPDRGNKDQKPKALGIHIL